MSRFSNLSLILFGGYWFAPGLCVPSAPIAQLGERQTEDLKVPGSIPGLGIIFWESCNFSKKLHDAVVVEFKKLTIILVICLKPW